MLSVERNFAIHAEYHQQELLKAAQNYRRAEAARAGQLASTTTTATRQGAGWTWPPFRVRRAATA